MIQLTEKIERYDRCHNYSVVCHLQVDNNFMVNKKGITQIITLYFN